MRMIPLMIGAALVAMPAVANGPPGGTLVDEVGKAYAQLQQYHATTQFTATTYSGRWIATSEAQTHVAFDRATGRLKIDSPEYLLVGDGTTLRIKTPAFPGQHIEVPQPAPLTYTALQAVAPVVGALPMPDVAFFFSDQPIKVLSEGTAVSATPGVVAPDAEDPRPYLFTQTHLGPMKLILSNDTRLIEAMRLGETPNPPDDRVEILLDVTIKSINQPLPDELFVFDTTGSQAVKSFTPGNVGGAAGGGGGGGSGGPSGGGHPLIGKVAPDFTRKDLAGEDWSLKDAEADIVVLAFWASWAPPCAAYVPAMLELQAWALKEEKSVQVVMVNCGEKVETVKVVWNKGEFEGTCLLDDFTVSDQYMMTVLPHTVVIAEGVVRYLHSGPEPDERAPIQKQVDRLLEEIAQKRAANETKATADIETTDTPAEPEPTLTTEDAP